MLYHVSWTIEVEADSPFEAARKCREIMLEHSSIATVFEVKPMKGRSVTIDLIDEVRS